MSIQIEVHLIERRFRLNLLNYVDVRALIVKIVEFKRKCIEMISFEKCSKYSRE